MSTFLSLQMYCAQLLKPSVNIVISWCKYLHSASACLFFDCNGTQLLETLGNKAVGVFFPHKIMYIPYPEVEESN